MRTPDSWYNEYRGRRNDGAVTHQAHREYVAAIQADAVTAALRDAEQRVLERLAATGIPMPADLLLALRAAPIPAISMSAPVQQPMQQHRIGLANVVPGLPHAG